METFQEHFLEQMRVMQYYEQVRCFVTALSGAVWAGTRLPVLARLNMHIYRKRPE